MHIRFLNVSLDNSTVINDFKSSEFILLLLLSFYYTQYNSISILIIYSV